MEIIVFWLRYHLSLPLLNDNKSSLVQVIGAESKTNDE